MWQTTIQKFNKYPSQQKVIIKLLQLGLKIDENKKVYSDDVEINMSSFAKSINTDRRVIVSTIENILKDNNLKQIFLNIKPAGPLLSNISEELGLGVIEIEGDAQQSGILNEVTNILFKDDISIRQLYASDPELSQTPKLTIITDKTVNGIIIPRLLDIDGVTKVSLY